MAREWQIVSTLHPRSTVSSNARTVGELKRDLKDNGIDTNGMNIGIRAERNKSFDDDNMHLPAYNSSTPDAVILTPSKTKNGVQ